jgi:hypothetical protein
VEGLEVIMKYDSQDYLAPDTPVLWMLIVAAIWLVLGIVIYFTFF